MKDSSTCPKCRHNELLYLSEVNDEGDDTSFRWRIARVEKRSKEAFFDRGTELTLMGFVEAYICRRCGFTELYTRDPSSIPVDDAGVKLVRGRPDRSYR